MTVSGTDSAGLTLTLGRMASGVGSYALSNTADLMVNGYEAIGYAGDGTFNQTGGTHNVSNVVTVGYLVGSTGRATLSGGTWTVTNQAFIGYQGVGSFDQSGGTFSVQTVNVGDQAGASGTVRVSGGVLTARDVTVGRGGVGSLTHSGGTVTATNSLVVGTNTIVGRGGTGSVTISGTARFQVPGTEGVINGSLTQTGGSHTAGFFLIGNEVNGNGQVMLSGGAIYVSNNENVAAGDGGIGTFTQSGGTNTVNVKLSLSLGDGSSGTYALTGGTVSSRSTEVAINGIGHFVHSDGTHTVRANGLTIGVNRDGVGTYDLSNAGVLSVTGDEQVGGNGAGTFNQSGGAHDVSGSLFVAFGSNSAGTVNLSGGRWTVQGSAVIGNNAPGIFNQSGGTFTASTSVLIAPVSGFANGSVYAMDGPGGQLVSPLIEIGRGGPGQLAVATGAVVSGTSIVVFPNGTLTMSGGAIVDGLVTQNGTMRVSADSSVQRLALGLGTSNGVDAELTVGSSLDNLLGATISGTGRITLSGTGAATMTGFGTVTPSVNLANARATLTVDGGTLLLAGTSLSSAGLIETLPGTTLLVRATSVTNTGNLEVAPASAMSIAGRVGVNSGRSVTISGGALATGGLTVNAGGSVSGFGLLSGSVTNSGNVTLSGPSQLVGALRNNAAGVVTVRNSQLLITGATVNNGTIRTQLGGSVVFDGGLSGNPVAGPSPAPVPGGATDLQPTSSVASPFIRQGSLSLAGNPGDPASFSVARVRPTTEGGQTSVLGTLAIQTDAGGAPLGTLDLADTALIVNYDGPSPIAGLRAALVSAYAPAAASHWTGTGISSSVAARSSAAAVGYGEAAEVLGLIGSQTAPFQGQTADATSVLVRYTLAGDATLDGVVDFNDLVKLAQNYNMTVSATSDGWWARGDFTYDGVVDFNDLVRLAQNYNGTLPAGAVPGAAAGFGGDVAAAFASVPEPAALGGLAVIAAAGLPGRRRRLAKR
jgi:hypothetical protein